MPLHPLRGLKRILPRGLFGRSLIIIIAPMVMLQGVVTYAFFVRHYAIVTRHMAEGAAADIAYLIALKQSSASSTQPNQLLNTAARSLGYRISFSSGQRLRGPYHSYTSVFTNAMNTVFASHFGETYRFTSRHVGKSIDLEVQLNDGLLRVMIPNDRLIASNADIFVIWMVGSSLVLIAVAVLFLRNQVKPIERLAYAAEAFGKGQAVAGFKPHGSTEVRMAARAFITMRERIDRYLQQRTEMLAGVSHDLKTPLTRLKLQLAMMGDGVDVTSLNQDIAEMEHMLDEYLDFARGEGGEAAEVTDVSELVREAAVAARQARGGPSERLNVVAPAGVTLTVKHNALKRCATNLVDNALKHGNRVDVTVEHSQRFVEIFVDDDGPGIPPERREEAFRPFHRLDEGRNLQTGGVGLGLAIARDIARGHGGDLILGQSGMGGLRATIRLPV
jgi:two-component system osmolarity sensor histidine kinase EnvZ